MSRMCAASGRSILLVVVTVLVPAGVSGQASVYVPSLDDAYRDLHALIAAGLTTVPSAAQQPYSRLTFARAIVEARRRAGRRGGARWDEALRRLEDDFAEELARLEGADDTGRRARARLRSLSLAVSFADSPARIIPTRYDGGDFIKADLNPLLQHNQGRVLASGFTEAVEGAAELTLGDRFVLHVQPRAWAGVEGDSTSGGATLLDGYVRGVFGAVAVEVGRAHLARGHSRLGGPMLSHNPRGFDLLRASFERPARLPWLLRRLGPITGAAWIADLGGDRAFPHSRLVVFELGARPTESVEVGLSLLNLHGGEGAPPATWQARLRDIFLVKPFGAQTSDKVLSGNLRVGIPDVGLELYLEGLSTDLDVGLSRSESFWTEAAWTAGVRLVGLGSDARADVWLEAHHGGVDVHSHGTFTDGVTLDRRVIGYPAGPMSAAWKAGFDWTGGRDRFSARAVWERYGGDEWDSSPKGAFWTRLSDNPDEIRVRAVLDWSREHVEREFRTSVRLGYEHVTRFDFTDRNRSNYLARVKLSWVPD